MHGKRKVDLTPHSDEEEARINAGIAADPDTFEWTEEDFKRARPASEVHPWVKRGRPKLPNKKKQVTLRLSPEVLDHFRATGPGWQTRIDEALKRVVAVDEQS